MQLVPCDENEDVLQFVERNIIITSALRMCQSDIQFQRDLDIYTIVALHSPQL